MRATALVPVGLLVAGIALWADALARGNATVYLVVVLPVFVADRSFEPLVGSLLLLAGIFTLPLAFPGSPGEPPPRPAPSADPGGRPAPGPSGGFGGVILLGPIPIVFGSWRPLSRRARWGLALAGTAIVLGVALVLYLGAFP